MLNALMFMVLSIFVGMASGFIVRCVVAMFMDDASLKNETHQKYEQH